MKVFLDTETTGKPKNFNAPVSDVDNWPRLVQLGYVVYSNDNYLVDEAEYIVYPEGFSIPEEASNIHGVTQEIAIQKGVPVRQVLDNLYAWLLQCDAVVGHNTPFDVGVLGAEYFREYKGSNPFDGIKIVDTMRSGTDFCQLPGGYGKYKWPKLSELYQKLFGEEMGAAHTALQDIKNTAKCYQAMVERGIIK